MRRALASAVLAALVAGCQDDPPRPPRERDSGPPPPSDGYSDPPGSGPFFVMDDLALARRDERLDLDGDGHPDGAVNDAWEPMRQALDNKLRSEVASGGYLIGLEVAGLDEPYAGQDDAVTLKIYPCNDVDGDPTNNFCGDDGCGEMRPKEGVIEDGQTPYRSDPVPVVDAVVDASVDADFVLDQSGFAVHLRRTRFVAYLPRSLGELRDGRFCGVASARDLNHSIIPICSWVPILCRAAPNVPDEISMTAYLVVMGSQPEIDMDGDGLERIEVDETAQVARCTDGDGRVIEGPDCLEDPGMNDGYAACFAFHAVPGELVLEAPDGGT